MQKNAENLNLRALCAPNYTKVPFCVNFTGRVAEIDAPSWGASGFLSRPEGRVAALYPPGENSDNKSKPLLWGA